VTSLFIAFGPVIGELHRHRLLVARRYSGRSMDLGRQRGLVVEYVGESVDPAMSVVKEDALVKPKAPSARSVAAVQGQARAAPSS
jgi:hypothetical protein